MADLERLMPAGLRDEWQAWRSSWGQSLASQGRLGELWAALEQWESRAEQTAAGPRYERATVTMTAPGVAGVFSEHSAGDLLDWMVELDGQIRQLDQDVYTKERAAPYAGQSFLGQWQVFVRGMPPAAPRVGLSGWLDWYSAHSGWGDRWYNTRELWADMERWDKAFDAWHKEFVSLGGKPTQTKVIVGPDKRPGKPLGLEDVRTFGTGALIVGGIIGLGYLVRSFR